MQQRPSLPPSASVRGGFARVDVHCPVWKKGDGDDDDDGGGGGGGEARHGTEEKGLKENERTLPPPQRGGGVRAQRDRGEGGRLVRRPPFVRSTQSEARGACERRSRKEVLNERT